MSLAGCASQTDLRADYDPAADFSRLLTYNFVIQPGSKLRSRPRTRQCMVAIAHEMQKRGYRLERYYPDLLVNFSAKLQKSQQAPVSHEYYDYRYYGAWPGYLAGEDIEAVDYPRGTVNVDLIDRSRMQLVWEGIAFGELTYGRLQEREAITQTIARIFDQFPFQAGEGRPTRTAGS